MKHIKNVLFFCTLLALAIMVSACTIQTAAPSSQSLKQPSELPQTPTKENAVQAEVVQQEEVVQAEVVQTEATQEDVAVSSLTVEQALTLTSLQDGGPAPELTNDVWLNSDPLRLADLRGNVVIIEFWTYG